MQEQTSNNQQPGMQGYMQQPPHVITVKDSLYLTDMLSWNLLAAKKAHFFAAQCQDQQIADALNRCGQMHQRHYQTILSQLNSTGSQNQTFQ
ncbi:hypothetical protein [Bacillus massiliglaciei]|uniref:hypothetical protein n=1 Tax=Bacillus massiliglaciei TaxID=1816693 RepID=UPI000A7423AC|nr:hypothetical protein [Bacillus massiliglaciei]